MILKLHGHIGDNASALVDGQLSAAEEERAWQHVLGCAGCRQAVEREGWIKQRLAGLDSPDAASVAGRLRELELTAAAWAEVDSLERTHQRRRAALSAVGAGSLGAVALAMITLTGAPSSGVRGPSPAPASLRPDGVGASIGGSTPERRSATSAWPTWGSAPGPQPGSDPGVLVPVANVSATATPAPVSGVRAGAAR